MRFSTIQYWTPLFAVSVLYWVHGAIINEVPLKLIFHPILAAEAGETMEFSRSTWICDDSKRSHRAWLPHLSAASLVSRPAESGAGYA